MVLVSALAVLAWGLAALAQTETGSTQLMQSGGFEGEGAKLHWEQESLAGSTLIVEADENAAHSGEYLARLGGKSNTVDTLDQLLGSWPAYYTDREVGFYCRAPKGGKGDGQKDVLRVLLVDDDTGRQFPLGQVEAPPSEWTFYRYPIAPDALKLQRGEDYVLRFEVDSSARQKPATFEIDDVAIGPQAGHRGMMLPIEPPDLLPDEDGDIPYENTVGHSAYIINGVHRDLPNLCSCGYQGAHKTVVIQTMGFSSLDGVVVKFKVPKAANLKPATNIQVNGNQITCTVPDAPGGKSYLGRTQIKVKLSRQEKTWLPSYDIDTWGNEVGFWYGFPDKITGVQLTSSSTPNVLGGDTIQVHASGMAIFAKWRKNAGVCGDRPQDLTHPAIFVKDGSGTKVKVIRSSLHPVSPNCGAAPQDWTWEGTMSDEGAPTICSSSTPCIPTNTLLAAVFLNPDNVDPDPATPLAPLVPEYKTQMDNFLEFAAPLQGQRPTIAGASPAGGPSLGGTVISASGNNLKRVTEMGALDQAADWTNLHGENGYPAATTLPHHAGAAGIRIRTADDLEAQSSSSLLNFSCSFQTTWLAGPVFQYPWKGSYFIPQDLAIVYSGPGENLTFTMNNQSGDKDHIWASGSSVYHETTSDGRQYNRAYFFVSIAPDVTTGSSTSYDVVVTQSCTGAVVTSGRITITYVGS